MEDVADLSPVADEPQITADDVNPNQVTVPMTPPPAEEKTEQEQQEQEQDDKDKSVKEVAEAAGLDYDAIVEEFNTSGGAVSAETKAKAVEAVGKIGIPADVVDQFFENQKAAAELLTMKAHKLTDGEAGYAAMTTWAQTSLSDQERKVYSELVANGSEKEALTAVSMLYEQYKKSNAMGGNRIKASNGSPSSGKVFRSQKEMAAALADPSVAGSPTKQQEIRETIARSVAAGYLR